MPACYSGFCSNAYLQIGMIQYTVPLFTLVAKRPHEYLHCSHLHFCSPQIGFVAMYAQALFKMPFIVECSASPSGILVYSTVACLYNL